MKTTPLSLITLSIALIACACTGQAERGTSKTAATAPPTAAESSDASTNAGAESFSGEVWADNWFSMWVDGQHIIEDSVPLTTERSFNAEVFTFSAKRPFVMSFMIADFRENDSGLEYIGEPKQQMGDGGFIAQFRRTSDEQIVAVSNASWRCLVIHTAPLNKECASSSSPESDCQSTILDEPAGWKLADFDDSAWSSAVIHSAADVRPKDGYDEIRWDSSAELIWGPDLESDNTILCRARVE